MIVETVEKSYSRWSGFPLGRVSGLQAFLLFDDSGRNDRLMLCRRADRLLEEVEKGTQRAQNCHNG